MFKIGSESHIDLPNNDLPYVDVTSVSNYLLADELILTNNSIVLIKKCTLQPNTLQPNVIEFPDTSEDYLDISNQNIQHVQIRTVTFLHLTHLDISNNLISFLPDIHTLRSLKCNNCLLTSLPVSMRFLELLECRGNLIRELHPYKAIKSIDCTDNYISTLPDKIPTLKTLIASDNYITDMSYEQLVNFTAYNCPILSIRHTSNSVHRSGIFIHGQFKWITTSHNKISSQYLLLDWVNCSCKVQFSSKFAKRLSKFLFI